MWNKNFDTGTKKSNSNIVSKTFVFVYGKKENRSRRIDGHFVYVIDNSTISKY